ncbi:MAG TPA: ArsA-related P-loop ATPase [Candidatus Binataceae bacterium]
MTLPRLLFVTGKGGTGKSTIAAALAIALSRRRPTTLADLDRRLAAATILGATPAGAAPACVNDRLDVIALSARAELESFIERIVPVRAISRRMLRSRTFGYVTAALPGLEAFLLVERLRMMAGDAALQDRAVVVDAPASGSALELLSIARGVRGIAPVGTLGHLADNVEAFLADRQRFGVVLTVVPEELALKEALESAATLRERLGIAVVAAIVNRAPSALFEAAELAALGGLPRHASLANRRRSAHQFAAHARRELAAAGLRAFELPMLYTAAVGKREVHTLGRALAAQLADR